MLRSHVAEFGIITGLIRERDFLGKREISARGDDGLSVMHNQFFVPVLAKSGA